MESQSENKGTNVDQIEEKGEESKSIIGKEMDRRTAIKSLSITGAAGLAGCVFGGSDSSQDLGEPVSEINFLTPSFVTREDETRRIARQWEEALGLSFNINSIDFTTWLDRIYAPPVEYEDMTVWTWSGNPERISPSFILETLTSSSNANAPGYENSQYDELYDQLLAEFDAAERDQIIEEMQNVILEDVPVIEFLRPPQTNAINTTKWNIDPQPIIGTAAHAVQAHHTASPNRNAFESDEVSMIGVSETRYNRPNPMNMVDADLLSATGHVWDPLRRFGMDGTYQNWAVREFEVVGDNTIDLHLREGMQFHDGESVTASDLAFTLNMFASSNFPRYSAFADPISDATVETDLTTRLKFSEPNSLFLESGAVLIKILPEHIWREISETEDNPVNYSMSVEEMVGSGPFEAVEMSDTGVAFRATGNHWSNPDYEEWRMATVDSPEAVRANIAGGNAHLSFQDMAVSLGKSAAEDTSDVELVTESGLYWMALAMDVQSKPFSDRVFRKALQKTLNANEINQVFYDNEGVIANGTLIHPDLEFGGDFPGIDELYDVEEARSMLREAGYGWDGNDNLHYPDE